MGAAGEAWPTWKSDGALTICAHIRDSRESTQILRTGHHVGCIPCRSTRLDPGHRTRRLQIDATGGQRRGIAGVDLRCHSLPERWVPSFCSTSSLIVRSATASRRPALEATRDRAWALPPGSDT